jgi:hypothetical protein
MLSLLTLSAGLILGTKLNISNETMLNVALLGTTVTASIMGASIAAPIATSLLGLGVSTLIKNIITDKYTTKRKELEVQVQEQKVKISEESIHAVASKAAVDGFWCLTSTLAFTAIPLQLLSLVKGLGALLAPISIITLVCKGWIYVTTNPITAIKNGLLVALVALIAYTCIGFAGSGGAFTYFLALVSIPSIFLNNKKEKEETTKETEESIYNADAFLYGGSTNSASIIGTGIVLGQTILWGSGKDVLGTIVNGDASVLLDPLRLPILVIVVSFLALLSKTNFVNNVVNSIKPNDTNTYSKLYKNTLGWLLKGASLVYCLCAFNIFVVLGLVIAGLILNTIDNKTVRNVSIPLLLIVGVFSGF